MKEPTARELLADQFLTAVRWYFAEDRGQTRRAARDFLLELPEEEFSETMEDLRVVVTASSADQVATSMPYRIAVDVQPGCARFDRLFQLVHLSPEIEKLEYSELRAIVFGMLTQAFAVAGGLDEAKAFQLARETAKMELLPAARRLQ
jgi:hypothetical protein